MGVPITSSLSVWRHPFKSGTITLADNGGTIELCGRRWQTDSITRYRERQAGIALLVFDGGWVFASLYPVVSFSSAQEAGVETTGLDESRLYLLEMQGGKLVKDPLEGYAPMK